MGLLGVLGVLGCGNGTPVSIEISENPHDPFGAVVWFGATDAPLDAWVEVLDADADSRLSPVTAITGEETSARLVRGLRAGEDFDLIVRVSDGNQTWEAQPQTFSTPALPDDWPACQVTVDTAPEYFDKHGVVCTNGVRSDALTGLYYCVDRQGRPVWSLSHKSGMIMRVVQPLPNGGFGAVGYDSSAVIRFKAGGGADGQFSADAVSEQARFAHDFIDGHEIIGFADGQWRGTVAFMTYTWDDIGTNDQGQDERRLATGVVVLGAHEETVLWDWSGHGELGDGESIDPLLPYDRLGRSAVDPERFMHANALVHRILPDDREELWMSLRHQDWIINIDPETDGIRWRLGKDGDFTLVDDLDAASPNVLSDHNWFYAQHAPTILSDDGTRVRLALFDNGKGRPGNSGSSGSGDDWSRALILDLDTDSMLAAPVWSWGSEGLDADDSFYGSGGGSVHLLPDGEHLQVVKGWDGAWIAHVRMSDGEIVWKLECEGDLPDEQELYRGFYMPDVYSFGR